jgi:nitrate reductase NapE component
MTPTEAKVTLVVFFVLAFVILPLIAGIGD